MRELRLIESRPAHLDLSAEDAATLRALGQCMAGSASWWGEVMERGSASVINVTPVDRDRYQVIFNDVVGVVRLKQLQIEVVPKIPLEHFLYLAAKGVVGPRIAHVEVAVAPSKHLVDVIAAWCLRAAERLLSRGLRPDYQSHTDEQPAIRGELLPCETAMELIQGRALIHCRYDELSDDAALNRVVKAACIELARQTFISEPLRARARRAIFRFVGVGPLQPRDVRVHVDRLSKDYADVIPLSLLVLRGLGVSSKLGTNRGSAFLFRTPNLIEDGLRNFIREALPDKNVIKRRFWLGKTGLSMNPDLVFNYDAGVGDVKYRYLKKDWHRSDLNQVIAFAAAARCHRALIIGFSTSASAPLPRDVPVGSIWASCIAWIASEDVDIDENVDRLTQALRNWSRDMHAAAVGARLNTGAKA